MIQGRDPIFAGYRWLCESQPISNQRMGLGFPTVRGVLDPGDHRSRPRLIGVVNVRKDLRSGDGTISSPSAACCVNPSQSAISQWGWGFPHRTGR